MYQRPSMLDILNFKPLNTKKLQMFKVLDQFAGQLLCSVVWIEPIAFSVPFQNLELLLFEI